MRTPGQNKRGPCGRKKLQISAAGNPEAIDVAMTQIKKNIKIFRQGRTFVMPEWAQE